MAQVSSVYNIEIGLPFVDALAAGLMERLGGENDPLALARAQVLLPNRRACRALAEAFLRLSRGRPMVLPRLVPVGDMDEEELALVDASELGAAADLPPPIAPLRRRLLLARLIQLGPGKMEDLGADQAVRLSSSLARLIDQLATERLSFAGLASLVPDQFAHHWQLTLEFLSIVTEHWPKILAEENSLDPAERRNRVLAWQARVWSEQSYGHPIIAAGSTGSVPATAELMSVVARLPQGAVVLPGLDIGLDERSWNSLSPTHPQFGLKQLLERLGVVRADVAPWQTLGLEASTLALRQRVVSEAMRPAETTGEWADFSDFDSSALAGLTRIDCATSHEEAGVIALILRNALESEDGGSAALVTPDRNLGRRVAAELRRWQIEIDDSAGVPLSQTPPGVFLRLTARAVAESAAPVPLLAALKHPLALGSLAPGIFRGHVRSLEMAILRGPRPSPGFAALARTIDRCRDVKVDGARASLSAWVGGLAAMARPFSDAMVGGSQRLSHLLRLHIDFAEALATTEHQKGADALWVGEAGEAAASFIAEMAEAADLLPSIHGSRYPALLEALMEDRVVRPRAGTHPRLAILGPLEARLQSFDTVVLGGLNEGTWPAQIEADPWMSRPMRDQFGLPSLEQRVGLAAHDFQQAASSPRVVLTRAERVEGVPSVPSRWLTRLENVVCAAGHESAWLRAGQWRNWRAQLDRPDHDSTRFSTTPPVARPPVTARPRKLSVTQIETWMRDPYAIYARHILKLSALDSIDAAPNAAAYGIIVHDALARFLSAYPSGPLPHDAVAQLIVMGEEAFSSVLGESVVGAFWLPRFERIAHWFVAKEIADRSVVSEAGEALSEQTGEMILDAPGGAFKLTARADRINRHADGTLEIIDYKTGALPSKKEVKAGFAPQLPLEAAIACAGGFAVAPVSQLYYWRLSGGEPAGKVQSAGKDGATLAAEARAGLEQLIARFDHPDTVYASRPRSDEAPSYSDYEHLARVKEWAAGEEDPE